MTRIETIRHEAIHQNAKTDSRSKPLSIFFILGDTVHQLTSSKDINQH